MSTEWLYVLELAPSRYVKVGRTASLPKRLTSHLANAAFGGGGIERVFSFACADSEAKERQLLVAVGQIGGATLVHGKETFAGVTFMEVAAIADRVAGRTDPAHWALSEYPTLIADCAAALDAAGVRRIGLESLRKGLVTARPAAYHHLTNAALGAVLRRAGITPNTVWCGVARRGACGIKLEWLALTA